MWGWLAKIPGAIGGAVKTGVGQVGKFGRQVGGQIGGQLGGMMDEGEDDELSMMRTPPFNPAARAAQQAAPGRSALGIPGAASDPNEFATRPGLRPERAIFREELERDLRHPANEVPQVERDLRHPADYGPLRATRFNQASGARAVTPTSGSTMYDQAQRSPLISTSTNAGDIPTEVEPRHIADAPPPRSLFSPITDFPEPPARAVSPSKRPSPLLPDPVRTEVAERPLMSDPSAIGRSSLPATMATAPERREDVPLPQLPGHPGEPRVLTGAQGERERAKYDYVMATRRDKNGQISHRDEATGQFVENKPKRRAMDILKNAGLGALQGAQSDPDNRLAGAVGGAATAGIWSAADPQAGPEYRFDQYHAPRMEAENAEKEKQNDRARRVKGEETNQRIGTARAGQIEMETASYPKKLEIEQMEREARLKKAQADIINANRTPDQQIFIDENDYVRSRRTGGYILDPVTKQPIKGQRRASADGRPMSAAEAEKQAELQRLADEGSPEAIAESSLQVRLPSIQASLPASTREIIERGIITTNGRQRTATQAEIKEAQAMLDRRVEQERKAILADTRGTAAQKSARSAVEKLKPGAAGNQGTRSLSGLVEKYFNQSKK